MNQKHTFQLATALLCSSVPAAAVETSSPPVITNFQFGLVCGSPDNRRVCFQTNVVQVSNESRCIFNHTLVACTWYGYSFDYNSRTDTTINCEDSWDLATRNGNPYEVNPTPTTSFKYDLDLKQGSHHFFIAKYQGGEKDAGSPSQTTLECSFRGSQLFLVKAQFDFAEKMKPLESVPDVNHAPPGHSTESSEPQSDAKGI